MICSPLSLPLTGCIQFQNRPLTAAESASRIEMRTLSSEGLREFNESATGRETRWPFQSWNVDQLTLAAMYYHPDLALAGAQAGSEDAATITAAQRPNPSITILPSWVSNAATGINPWIIASALTIPIKVEGKRQFHIDKAEISLIRRICEYRMWLDWRVDESAWRCWKLGLRRNPSDCFNGNSRFNRP